MLSEREILWRLRGRSGAIALFSLLKFYMSAEEKILVTEDFTPLRAYHLIEPTGMTLQGVCKNMRILKKYEILRVEKLYGDKYYVLNYKGE